MQPRHYIFGSIFLVLFSILVYVKVADAQALRVFTVPQGGTGWGNIQANTLLTGNGTGRLATTSIGSGLSLSGGVLSATGGSGGSGNVATSSTEQRGQIPYWTSTGGTPATLGTVATTTSTFSGPFNGFAGLGALVGGTNSTITWTGLATTSQPASSNLLVSNGGAGVYGAATTSLTISSPLTTSGTPGALVGGTNLTIGLDTSGDWTGTIDGNNFAGGAIGLGDLLYGSGAGSIAELGIGTAGNLLGISGGLPVWTSTSTLLTESEYAAFKDWNVVGGNSFLAPTTSLGIIVNASSTFNGSLGFRFGSTTNLTASNNVYVQNILGVASTTPTQALSVNGNAQFGKAGVETQFFWDNNNGRLGIGTLAPAERLHVSASTGNFTTMRFDSGSTQGYFFAYDGDNTVNLGSNSNAQLNIKVNNSTVASFDTNKHYSTTGTVPTVGTCGATPTVVTGSNDNNGQIKIGGGSVNACTITFAAAWTNAPQCFVNLNITAATATVLAASSSVSNFIVRGSASNLGGSFLHYHCVSN